MPTTTNWIARLPADRKKAITAVRKLVNEHLPEGYEEHVGASMINWQVPKTVLAETYNGQPFQYIALASQKNYMALYLCGVYADDKLRRWFEASYKTAGKKLDMGKACLRFRTLEALPLEVVGEAIAKVPLAEYVARYKQLQGTKKGKKVA